mmetsp:Transcript_27955/g.61247  ORF Transcript_27955/g.61247 Transcript_27955/m.61247 type:complete len:257 (-) Transcript_27955:14-784(-)
MLTWRSTRTPSSSLASRTTPRSACTRSCACRRRRSGAGSQRAWRRFVPRLSAEGRTTTGAVCTTCCMSRAAPSRRSGRTAATSRWTSSKTRPKRTGARASCSTTLWTTRSRATRSCCLSTWSRCGSTRRRPTRRSTRTCARTTRRTPSPSLSPTSPTESSACAPRTWARAAARRRLTCGAACETCRLARATVSATAAGLRSRRCPPPPRTRLRSSTRHAPKSVCSSRSRRADSSTGAQACSISQPSQTSKSSFTRR